MIKPNAGFDPIFFLHHANIDRLYAFWEYVHPSYYWVGKGWKRKNDPTLVPFGKYNAWRYKCHLITDKTTEERDGTFYQDKNTPVYDVSPLAPFRHKTPDYPYWTSSDVRGLVQNSDHPKCKGYITFVA
jgi:tyrosinase